MQFSRTLFFLSLIGVFSVLFVLSLFRFQEHGRQSRLVYYQTQVDQLQFAARHLKAQAEKRFCPFPSKRLTNASPRRVEVALMTLLTNNGLETTDVSFVTWPDMEAVRLSEYLDRMDRGFFVVLASWSDGKVPVAIVRQEASLLLLAQPPLLSKKISRAERDQMLEVFSLFLVSFIILFLLIHKGVNVLVRENRGQAKRLLEVEYSDAQTGLLNQRSFQKLMHEELQRARRYRLPFSVVMMDLDGLKMTNDFFGRRGGDAAIENTASLLQKRVRTVDRVFYLGSGMFAILLPNTPISGAFIFAERLRQHLESAVFKMDEKELGVTGSFGVTEYRLEEDNLDSIIDRVENLLVKAKRTGRNKVS